MTALHQKFSSLKILSFCLPALGITPLLFLPCTKLDAKNQVIKSQREYNNHETVDLLQKWLQKRNLERSRECFLLLLQDPQFANTPFMDEVALQIARLQVLKGQNLEASQTIQLHFKPERSPKLVPYTYLVQALTLVKSDPHEAYQLYEKAKENGSDSSWPSEDRITYQRLKQRLDERAKKEIQSAQRLYASGLYSESIVPFKQIISEIKKERIPLFNSNNEEAKLQLSQLFIQYAQALYNTSQFEKAYSELNEENLKFLDHPSSSQLAQVEDQRRYLQALSLRELNRYPEAQSILKLLIERAKSHRDNDLLQKSQLIYAQTLLGEGKLQEALANLQSLVTLNVPDTEKASYRRMIKACILKANVYEEMGRIDESLKELNALNSETLSSELKAQTQAHLARLLFKKRQILPALEKLSTSLQLKQSKLKETLSSIELLSFILSDKQLITQLPPQKVASAFQDLISSTHPEMPIELRLQVATALTSHSYIASKDKKAQEITTLLKNWESLGNIDLKAQTLFTLAYAQNSLEESARWFDKLKLPKYKQTIWYYRGLITQAEGYSQQASSRKDNAISYIHRALELYRLAAADIDQLLHSEKSRLKNRISLGIIHTEVNLQGGEELKANLEKLRLKAPVERYDQIVDLGDEWLWTEALILNRLNQFNHNSYALEEISCYEALVRLYPNSSLSPSSYFELGRLFKNESKLEESRDAYLKISIIYPDHLLVPVALELAASVSDTLKESKKAYGLRQEILSRFPHYSKNPSIKLRLFSLNDYLKKVPESYQNLQQIIIHYSNSDAALQAYTLIALIQSNEVKDSQRVIDAWDDVQKKFDSLHHSAYEKGEILSSEAWILSFQAGLEKGRWQNRVSDFTHASKTLSALSKAIEHRPPSVKMEDCSIYEETLLELSTTYEKLNDYLAASETLEPLIHRNNNFLSVWESRAHLQLARFKLKQGQKEEALSEVRKLNYSSLTQSDQLLGHFLSAEIFKELNQYNEALTELAHILYMEASNEWHLKAMWLRYEILEKSEQKDQALVQLRAISELPAHPLQKKAKDQLSTLEAK